MFPLTTFLAFCLTVFRQSELVSPPVVRSPVCKSIAAGWGFVDMRQPHDRIFSRFETIEMEAIHEPLHCFVGVAVDSMLDHFSTHLLDAYEKLCRHLPQGDPAD
jgi:hypothetical protein